MNASLNVSFDEVIEYVEEKLQERAPSLSLNKSERMVLKATWEGLSYVAISKSAECHQTFNTLQTHIGPELWRKLTLILGREVGKRSFKREITLDIKATKAKSVLSKMQDTELQADEKFVLKGASLPLLDGFVGRESEIESLLTLVNNYACIFLVGLEGIGKKSLVAHMLEEKQNQLPLNRVLWKSLVHRPSPEVLEHELVLNVGGEKDDDLIDRLCITPYIIILDSIDYLHVEEDGRPTLDQKYENLLQRISEGTFSKLIVIANQQTEASINLSLGGRTTVYNLSGLSLSASEIILGDQWDSDAKKELWKTTSGHPLMLHEAAKWKDYAPDLKPQLNRLTVLANLFGHLYERIFKRLMLSTSDLSFLKEISTYTQGVPFSHLLRKDPASMASVENLRMMGLIYKASNENGEAIIHTPPLLSRALMEV